MINSTINDTIRMQQKHISVRSYQKKEISEETKRELLLAAQSGSSSNFVQAYSIIEVRDLQHKEQLAEITRFSGHLQEAPLVYVFVADLYRHAVLLSDKGLPMDGIRNTEAFVVSVVDTTIAAQNLCIAAESLGLGICYIGGIRNDLFSVKELLGLPKYTVPLYAVAIGVPAERNDPKPRMPIHNLLSIDQYQTQTSTELSEYDTMLRKYYQTRNSNRENTGWIDKMTDFFKESRRPRFSDFLKAQGFTL